jgi:transposase
MLEVGRMLKRRFENIITYLRHRVTNAGSESINAKIQWVKYTARGFRNKQNFVNCHLLPLRWPGPRSRFH